MSQTRQAESGLRTPLYAFHLEHGARMAPFAGYEMPVNYSTGILTEHRHTRGGAGLFDVSHMGQIALRPISGLLEETAHVLEKLVPVDVIGVATGRQRYALFTNADGGILDDFMIANRGDHLLLVVNASRKAADLAHLRNHLSATSTVELLLDRALLALQGPLAEKVLARFAPEVVGMRFMDVRAVCILGVECVVSRSGYTGEDGYEISVPDDRAETLAHMLCNDAAVMPIGLGARDSLRLEAGFCLYGCDLDPATTPVMASLEWTIAKVRRAGGARAGGFPGAEIVLRQLTEGVQRRRVGLRVDDRTPVRGGALLYADANSPTNIGAVTSGGFSPSVGAPIAMGYVDDKFATTGTRIFTEVRGKRIPLRVSEIPFIPHRYKHN